MLKNANRKHIILTLTYNCNLNCIYCYEHYKENKKITTEIAINSIEKHLSNLSDFDECIIEFHGGEPFLEFDNIKLICEYTWSKCWPKPYLFFSTTNGTLIHGEIKSWLSQNKNRITLAASIDGTEFMHNLNRTNSFKDIDINFFKGTWPNQPVKMTISKETLPRLSEGVIFLHKCGFKIENNLAYGVDWSDKNNIDILYRELNKLAEFYISNPTITPCDLFSMEIKQIVLKENKPYKWCGVGTSIVAIDIDGTEYPCHSFLPVSIGEKKARLSNKIDFFEKSNFIDPKCCNCILLPICPTCYGVNYLENNKLSVRNIDLCNLTKIRALACSYLEAKRIINNSLSLNLSENEKYEKYLLLDAIDKIQNEILTNYEGD